MIETTLFGTDGIRENVASELLSMPNVTKLGRILGHICLNIPSRPSTRCIAIGRDTRASGLPLEQALVLGISSVGVDCELLGVLPTSGLAHHTRHSEAGLGVMISASHNPHHDNGFKIFDSLGFKISEQLEHYITTQFFAKVISKSALSKGGKIIQAEGSHGDYYRMIKQSISSTSKLKDIRIVLDCAHGAAYAIAPRIFEEMGLDITIIGASPDGFNINYGFGSEAPARLKTKVLNSGAHLGIAFDGDADRVTFVDENGEEIDGDALLAAMAIDLKNSKRLHKNTVVTTVMSGLGLERALKDHGVEVIRTDVGDKFISRAMLQGHYSFGGENSGHLLFFPETTTGDSIFASVKFISMLARSGMPASKLVAFYRPSPKILKSIDVIRKVPLTDLPKTEMAILRANAYLKDVGRVMFRYSGTENKARLLVEARSEDDCEEIAKEILTQFNRELTP